MTENKVQVKSYIDPDQLRADVAFSENNLDDAMIQQAGMSAHYGALAAKAQQQTSLLKVRLSTLEAKVYKELRDKFAAEGQKTTEAQLKMEVAADRRILQAEAALINSQYQADIGKSAFEAFKQRRDMLVQISKNRLEEFRGDLRMQTANDVESLKQKALEVVSGK